MSDIPDTFLFLFVRLVADQIHKYLDILHSYHHYFSGDKYLIETRTTEEKVMTIQRRHHTTSLDDDNSDRVRQLAEERRTSISGILRELIEAAWQARQAQSQQQQR
jgi:hypothetical protein